MGCGENNARRLINALVGVGIVGLGCSAPVAQAAPVGPRTIYLAAPFVVTAAGVCALIAGILLILVGAGIYRWIKRHTGDEQYADVAGGHTPARSASARIIHADVEDAPVLDHPPEGIPPRLAGVIVCRDEVELLVDENSVVVTIIDMAVRGYITIDQQATDEYTLSRTDANPARLDAIERMIYDGLFDSGPVVERGKLAKRELGWLLQDWITAIQEEATGREWYKETGFGNDTLGKVGGAIATVGFFGIVPVIVMVKTVPAMTSIGFGFLTSAVLAFGVILAAAGMGDDIVRTAGGSAAAIRTIGFKNYLKTVEAHQIRLVPGTDIFSDYLPYSLAFSYNSHWADLFVELAAAGTVVPRPTWYTTADADTPIWIQIAKLAEDMYDALEESINGK